MVNLLSDTRNILPVGHESQLPLQFLATNLGEGHIPQLVVSENILADNHRMQLYSPKTNKFLVSHFKGSVFTMKEDAGTAWTSVFTMKDEAGTARTKATSPGGIEPGRFSLTGCEHVIDTLPKTPS